MSQPGLLLMIKITSFFPPLPFLWEGGLGYSYRVNPMNCFTTLIQHFFFPESFSWTYFTLNKFFNNILKYRVSLSHLQLGVDTVPVLVGPVSYLLLSKPAKGVEKTFPLLSLLGKILPIYK